MNIDFNALLLFTMVNIVYVILTTLKSLILMNSTNKHLNGLAHSIAYGYYAIVIKLTANNDFIVGIVGNIISNYIGTVIAVSINNFLERNKGMCFKISINSDFNIIQADLESRLTDRDYNKVIKKSKDADYICYSIYCKKCKSDFLKEFLKRWDDNIKWHIEKY